MGICDAVGAACGYARGGIGGAIGLGCIASAIAIIEFSPMDNLQETVRDVTSTEAAFSTAAQSSGQPAGMQVGVYHNQILRAVFERQGASLSQMNEEEIALAIEREMKDMGLQEGWLAEVAEQYSLQDFKYSLEGDTSAEAYVGRLCSKYPFVGQELVVLRTVLEGFDSINNEDGLASYSESVIRIIAESAIQNEAKTTLISGTSVAFESKQLWNLSKSE